MRSTMQNMRATMAGAMTGERQPLPFPLLLAAASLLTAVFGWIVY